MGGGRIVEIGGVKPIGMETGTPRTEAERVVGKPGSGAKDSSVASFASPPPPSADSQRLERLVDGIAGDVADGTARSRRPEAGSLAAFPPVAPLPSGKYSALADIGLGFTQLASTLLMTLARWIETASAAFVSTGEPASFPGEAARDIALLQTAATERVPGLTPELAAAFEKGARIVQSDGTYRWVGEGKPKTDDPKTRANEANFKIGENWQGIEGFGEGNPHGLQQAWANLRSSAQDRGIMISYERPLLHQGSASAAVEVLKPETVDVLSNTELVLVEKQIGYLSQLLNLLPPSYFKDGGIREIRIALHPAKRGVDSAHVEVKDGILQIGLAQLRGSRVNFIAAFFRGMGQVAVEKLASDPQLQKTYQALNLGDAQSIKKFISEFTMLYITAGDKLRETIASSEAKDLWQAVYEKVRDEVFSGKEYSKFEEPAASSPATIAEAPTFPKVWTGGAISKWDFPTVSSVGFLGQVQEVRTDGVVVLSAVKYLKDGRPVEENVSVEIQGAKIRSTAPVPGQWVHYSPARPRTTSDPEAFEPGARTVMVDREAMLADRPVDQVFVDNTVTVEAASLKVGEVNSADTASATAEIVAPAELPVAKSYSADELGQRVYAVHVLSRDIPKDKWPRFIKEGTLLAQTRDDAFIPVLHWTLGNTPVNTVGNIGKSSKAKNHFAIIVPVGKLEGIVNISPESTTTLGDTPIPREAVVLAPQYVDISAFTSMGLKVVTYTGDLQTAVRKYIKDNNGLDIECKRDAQANLTPDIRVDGGARVLDPLGFFKPLLAQKHMSYGDGVLGVKGDGFRFGVLDGLMEATVKSYGVYSDVPGLGTDATPINRVDLQIRRELLAHHIMKLEGWILGVESTGKFNPKQVAFFKANLENAKSLLHFIDADLKVRIETGSKNKGIGLTFNFAAQTNYYLYLGRRKIHQRGDKIEEAKTNMLNERPDIGPNLSALVSGMTGMPSKEFMDFVDQSKTLKSNDALKQKLILAYAMNRWMVLSLQEAQREGLDLIMSKALAKVGAGQTMKLKAFFKPYSDQGGHVAATAAALEGQSFIQRYYAEHP